ncbi:MAG TPA: hypothetical protein VGS57_01160 [Thermoanaerobaculia bacterium]|jgi:hypothetical protein|nr:hypothetical protein [Thermoanaerobaculia bacterium]
MSFKEDFKKGCQDSGGSWVEDADGSFTCNIGDVSIKCTGERCHLAAEIAPEVGIKVGIRADLIQTVIALLPPAKPAKPGY